MDRVRVAEGMMVDADLEWLIEMAGAAASWTELGVYCGRSALAVGLSLPTGGLLQLVDIHFQPEFYINLAWLLERRPALVVTLCQTSSDTASLLLPPTDVVFVDDDHTYEGVHASVVAWEDKCSILCGHDCPRWTDPPYAGHAGVLRAVNELCYSVGPVRDSGLWLRVGPPKESETP